jgi:hypothetical protein
LHSACRGWNKINLQDQTLNNFKSHFSTAYQQHKQMQGEATASSEYASAAITKPVDDDIGEAAMNAFANLATATAEDRGIFDTFN